MFLPFSPSGPVGIQVGNGPTRPKSDTPETQILSLGCQLFFVVWGCRDTDLGTRSKIHVFYLFTPLPTKVIFLGVTRCTPRLPLSKCVLYLYFLSLESLPHMEQKLLVRPVLIFGVDTYQCILALVVAWPKKKWQQCCLWLNLCPPIFSLSDKVFDLYFWSLGILPAWTKLFGIDVQVLMDTVPRTPQLDYQTVFLSGST